MRGRFFVFVLALLLVVPAAAAAQPSVIEAWRATDAGYIGIMMDRDPQGNLYSLGYTAAGDVIVVKKHDANGALLWSTVYNPDYRVQGRWLAADAQGNVLVSAFKISESSDMPSGWVTLKYDANGTLLWKDEIDAWAWPARLVVDAQGNAYVAGTMWLTGCSGNTTWDFVTVKYGPDGQRLWVRHFDNGCGTSNDVPSSIALSPDGARVVVTGGFASSGFLALSYDAAGNLLWSAARDDFFGSSDVVFTSPTEAVIASSVNSLATGFQMALLKFDGSGRLVWSRTYPQGEFADRLAVDSTGNLAVIGRDYQGYSDWITLKTDAAGNLLWSQRLDASRNNDEVPTWVEFDRHGNVYVAGRAGPSPSTGTVSYLKGVVAKYAADGRRLWAVTDDAIGLVVRLGSQDEVYFFGQGIMRIVRYEQTGATDPLPQPPAELSARNFFTGVQYVPVLSWRDAADNEFWVEVERCTGKGCGDFAIVGQTRGENAVEFEDPTAAPGSTYTYRVRAVGFMGASAYSGPVTLTVTNIVAPTAPAAPQGLSAPMGLDARAVAKNKIALRWTNTATNQSGVRIERCSGAGCSNFAQVAQVGGSAIGYTDNGLKPGTSYSYRVQAFNASGASAYSPTATATTSR